MRKKQPKKKQGDAPKGHTLFDLRQHSSTDLVRLEMAIGTGINECGDNKNLKDVKETLIAYRSIVQQAYTIAADREVHQVTNQILSITK